MKKAILLILSLGPVIYMQNLSIVIAAEEEKSTMRCPDGKAPTGGVRNWNQCVYFYNPDTHEKYSQNERSKLPTVPKNICRYGGIDINENKEIICLWSTSLAIMPN